MITTINEYRTLLENFNKPKKLKFLDTSPLLYNMAMSLSKDTFYDIIAIPEGESMDTFIIKDDIGQKIEVTTDDDIQVYETFNTFNETAERTDGHRFMYTTYKWSTYTATIIQHKSLNTFSWTIEELNNAIEPIHSSDYAEYTSFEEAEDDMFKTIEDRIGSAPERLNESIS